MKKALSLVMGIALTANLRAGQADSTIQFRVPDTLRAVQLVTDITVRSLSEKKWFRAELKTDAAGISMFRNGKSRGFAFTCLSGCDQPIFGLHTRPDLKNSSIRFSYNWQAAETYRLLISQATDSASGLTIISGYVFLPRENKWKYIGSGTIRRWHPSLLQPALQYTWSRKQSPVLSPSVAWIQRSNGSWKRVDPEQADLSAGKLGSPPQINVSGHYDSLQQKQLELQAIRLAIRNGSTRAVQDTQDVYYQVLVPGTGRSVQPTDTVTVFYKGWIFNTDQVFDQTGDKPAVFPLNRLIRGWQIGVPLLKTGGKIQLVIPSDMAYSARTRSAKIPPNSILVFEIEVVEAKPAVVK